MPGPDPDGYNNTQTMSNMSASDWNAAAGGLGMMAAGFGDLFPVFI